jgi:hypothetical protein
MKIKDRIKTKSPRLFKRITNFCITLGAIGGALLIAPIALPAGVIALSGYFVTAGVIGASVSKLTVEK